MDKFLGQDIPEQERWQFLQDNADAVEKIGYTHRFTPEELAQKKETFGRGINHHQQCLSWRRKRLWKASKND